MRIAILDVGNLVAVRETFRPRWRNATALAFAFWALVWWGAVIQKAPDLQTMWADGALRARSLTLTGCLVLVFALASSRRGAPARLLFAFSAGFVGWSILLMVAGWIWVEASSPDPPSPAFLLGGALAAVALCWFYCFGPAYALCRSLVPLGRWKPYRHQVACSLSLWSGEWRSPGESPTVEAEAARVVPKHRVFLRLGAAGGAFAVGLIGYVLAVVAMVSSYFSEAVYHRRFGEAWYLLRHFSLLHNDPGEEIFQIDLFVPFFLFATIALLSTWILGDLWTRHRRERIRVDHSPLSDRMSAGEVLLLRSFQDDLKTVPGQHTMLHILFFYSYAGTYTYKQLVENRLACVGGVRGLGPDELPSLGGSMHVGPPDDWEAQIAGALPRARMVVVLLGTPGELWRDVDRARDRGFWREMEMVRDGKFLDKAVFIAPALIWPRAGRRRWTTLAGYLPGLDERGRARLEKLEPEKVLAFCFHGGDLVVITGEQKQLAYESALDLAAVLILAEPARGRAMFRKYLRE
ncbi:MAG TPA: hypothetical protein VHG51_06395 [Longimicrobiaceae bacterium]|nr:hypothetical protein [Longimicrobiaceae bacterium]